MLLQCVVIEILTHQTSWTKWQSYVFRAKLHNYIITISKLDAVWLPHWQGRQPFSGGKFTSLGQEGCWSRWFILITNTLWVKVLNAIAVFQAEMWWRVGRTGGGTDSSPRIAAVFFSSYKWPKTVTVSTLLLFGPVMLLCGKFLCILWVKDLCS